VFATVSLQGKSIPWSQLPIATTNRSILSQCRNSLGQKQHFSIASHLQSSQYTHIPSTNATTSIPPSFYHIHSHSILSNRFPIMGTAHSREPTDCRDLIFDHLLDRSSIMGTAHSHEPIMDSQAPIKSFGKRCLPTVET